MKHTHDTRPWSQRRTEALLSLLQTQAPPDFQDRVLMRVRELHQEAERKRPGRWQPVSAWLPVTVHSHPVILVTLTGSISALLFISSLAWWPSVPGGSPRTPAAEVTSLAEALRLEAQPTVPQEDFNSRTVEEEDGQPTVYPPVPIDLIVSATVPPLADKQETPRTPFSQRQVAMPSPSSSTLQSPGKSFVATPAPPHRSRRGSPGESKGVKNSQLTGKPPSA